jgi:hypothetical protein
VRDNIEIAVPAEHVTFDEGHVMAYVLVPRDLLLCEADLIHPVGLES